MNYIRIRQWVASKLHTIADRVSVPEKPVQDYTEEEVLKLLGIKGFRDDVPPMELPEKQLDTWFLTCDTEEVVKYERVQSFLRYVANGKF